MTDDRESIRDSLIRCHALLDAQLRGRAVNASFARRKGEGLRPDFRAQLVNPPPFGIDRLLNPPKGQPHD